MYNRYIRNDQGTYTRIPEEEPRHTQGGTSPSGQPVVLCELHSAPSAFAQGQPIIISFFSVFHHGRKASFPTVPVLQQNSIFTSLRYGRASS